MKDTTRRQVIGAPLAFGLALLGEPLQSAPPAITDELTQALRLAEHAGRASLAALEGLRNASTPFELRLYLRRSQKLSRIFADAIKRVCAPFSA